MSNKRYALKGINDDATECSICGKVELQRVMWLVEIDADGNECGEAFNCGTTCGARMLKSTRSKLNTAIKNYQGKVAQMRYSLEARHPAYIKVQQIIKDWERQGMNYTARKATAEWDEMLRLSAEAKDWAAQQPVLVEL